MRTLTIETGEGKGRSFSAAVLAYATASALWDGGAAETTRPVFLQLACSEAEARPVLANLQAGRKAVMHGEGCLSKGDRVELLRSAGYVFRAQRFAEGVILTAYLHELFRLLDGPDKAAVLLGEVGSGKTTVTLATAAARGARRVLVMYPPHLQKTWADQAAAVVPSARTVVLDDVGAVEAFAADQRDGMAIAILSREAAKLGHPWSGIAGWCPECGAAIETPAEENARKRLRCEHAEFVADGRAARAAERLAALLAPVFPDRAGVRQLIRGRVAQRFLDVLAKRHETGTDPWSAVQPRIAPLARRVGTWIMGEEREPQRGEEAGDVPWLGHHGDALHPPLASWALEDVDRKCAAQELGAVCRPPDSRHACVSKRRLRPPS
ncbi:hypothetical protein [Sorangium sp. So ce1153]|uniref:hypothetical protein n=1 Tax=Sorangium sp. So ce1153 TaxID=3133333 RepID=UPI003F641C0E